MTSPKDRIEVYPNVFVSKRDLKAHEERMERERMASEGADTMSPKEEEEWEIAEKIRSAVQEKTSH